MTPQGTCKNCGHVLYKHNEAVVPSTKCQFCSCSIPSEKKASKSSNTIPRVVGEENSIRNRSDAISKSSSQMGSEQLKEKIHRLIQDDLEDNIQEAVENGEIKNIESSREKHAQEWQVMNFWSSIELAISETAKVIFGRMKKEFQDMGNYEKIQKIKKEFGVK